MLALVKGLRCINMQGKTTCDMRYVTAVFLLLPNLVKIVRYEAAWQVSKNV